MRQLLSTALVALVVAALTAITVSAVAQSPAQPPLSPTVLNADTVDGLDAVKATSQKAKRQGKLVATDAEGFLPSNIVKAKWGLITDKPAFLADGVVGWNELAGIPEGFADGIDDIGLTRIIVGGASVSREIAPGTNGEVIQVPCPAGKVVGGGFGGIMNSTHVNWSGPFDAFAGWEVEVSTAAGTVADAVWAYAVCLTTEPSTALAVAKAKVVRSK
jgi:hypothetical protein